MNTDIKYRGKTTLSKSDILPQTPKENNPKPEIDHIRAKAAGRPEKKVGSSSQQRH
jgi:hypothetical protein